MIEARVDVLLFVAWAAGGATLAWLAAARARTAAMVTLVALVGCVGLAALLGDARMSPVAGTLLEQDPYLRWWLTAASASLLAVHLVSVVSGGAWPGGPAMLLALAATGMALALHDRIAGLLIIGAASLVATERPRSIEGSPIRVPVIARATILATVLGIAAAGLATTIITPGHQLFFDTGAVNASLLLAAAALAVRAGGAPVADPVRSGSGLAPRPSSAVASGWLPAGTLLVLVASATTGFVRTGGDLEPTAVTTELIGIGALLVAAAVALVARDAGRILGAIVVSNGSLVIFVLVPGANSPTADDAQAAAGWLPWLAITASWVVGWLVVAAAGRASLRIPASRGWTRRRPLLALALLVGAALACGWPGTAVWQARLAVLERVPPQVRATALALSLVPLLGVVRLLLAGVRHAPRSSSLSRRSSLSPRDLPLVVRRQGFPPLALRRAPLASLLVLLLAFAPPLIVAGGADLPGHAARWSLGRSEHPLIDLPLVRQQLVIGEPESQLLAGGLRAVRSVDQVLRGLQGEVTADGPGHRLMGSRRAVDGTPDHDRVGTLECDRHQWAGGDELDE